jgi:hypothetical protein
MTQAVENGHIFRKWDRRSWTGLIWLRRGIGGGHLYMFYYHYYLFSLALQPSAGYGLLVQEVS